MKKTCSICSDFQDKEYSFQKYGSDVNNTYLPANAKKLVMIKNIKPGSNRLKQLKQCPECKTYYLYETDYEYFALGSEDEEFLTRLTEEEALEIVHASNT
ncbi:MAG TPA: hypothetical protein PKL83_01300 [bacterium]|nr:hypothetical protein [bacterium]